MYTGAYMAGRFCYVYSGEAKLETPTASDFAPYRADGTQGMFHRHGSMVLHTRGLKRVKVYHFRNEDDARNLIAFAWEWSRYF